MFARVEAEGRLGEYVVELTPGNGYDWWEPADARDLAQSILAMVIGNRGAGTYAKAFRDEVIARLSPSGWEITEREVLAWLQSR